MSVVLQKLFEAQLITMDTTMDRSIAETEMLEQQNDKIEYIFKFN